mmetsp:Transcript_51184/g.92013  ORF Transcript_51184/g.92013 Transcript_51184/m.92013 type:complete len:373 (+) Transcript_51184:128-1246(+)|eukprot:CAMPEP_0197624794 /NCGR_PEP_ID=MMETSP1338-20131121/4332_1 /TAXON_ID=43686 ORGANISM="Pelagodinium beii, Strain RCC1491" /NCGR_SAMPLE_ID=MMETSP1338 /ASSEMBLY_ACC=CAM_ASM_000754 /LENGTH=372 /DNA_ID=CAMNT_0043195023 /DNA_START=91 /DNA_END=1209 /DNA_ORIENTATION=-
MPAFSHLLPLAVLATVGCAEKDFKAWAEQHGKTYRDEVARGVALQNFRMNEEIIKALNSDPEDPAEYGHTQFSDLSAEDFRRIYLPKKMDTVFGRRGSPAYHEVTRAVMPESVDWRDHGAVTPVKDQSACGSCWAESAVGNIESRWFLARNASGLKDPVSLSVQQVIECDAHDDACYGGYPKGAYEYVIEHGGISSEAAYPYQVNEKTICLANQTFNQTCGDGMCDDPPLTSACDVTCSDKSSAHKAVAKIASWQALPEDEEEIAANLAVGGPVSICLDASGALGAFLPWLQFYHHGVANPRFCSKEVDHGVLAVGYGEEKGVKYWTIKNSWGTKWGESGYFRMVRGQKKCGIDTYASTAIIDKESDTTLVV